MSSTRGSVPNPRVTPTFGAVAFWIGLALVLWVVGVVAIGGGGRVFDFRAFYAAGEIVRQQPGSLYDLAVQKTFQDASAGSIQGVVPFYHPSFEALLYAPLSLMSYRRAYFAYLAWNLLLLGMCYVLAPSIRSPELKGWPRSALFFLFVPVLMCLIEGQDAILFLLLLCVVWRGLESNRDVWVGILLALGLFKLPLTITIALLLAVRRGGRLAAGFVAAAGVIALLCVGISGWRGSAEWVHLLGAASLASDHSAHAQDLIAAYPGAMPCLTGLLYLCGARLLSARVAFGLGLGLAVALLCGCLLLMRRTASLAAAFCMALLCAVLISPHLYLSDLSLLLFPILLLAGRAQRTVVAICYVSPFVLLMAGGWRTFAVAAVLPMLLLGSSLSDGRSESPVALRTG